MEGTLQPNVFPGSPAIKRTGIAMLNAPENVTVVSRPGEMRIGGNFKCYALNADGALVSRIERLAQTGAVQAKVTGVEVLGIFQVAKLEVISKKFEFKGILSPKVKGDSDEAAVRIKITDGLAKPGLATGYAIAGTNSELCVEAKILKKTQELASRGMQVRVSGTTGERGFVVEKISESSGK